MSTTGAALTLGVSLKMYFGVEETLDWCREVAEIASRHEAVAGGAAEIFVLPSMPVIPQVNNLFAGTPVSVGAQNLFWEDRGAFTGEVSGAMLRELGCRYVEVGHAERRRLFGESNDIVALKVAAALRNSLLPVICVGEAQRGDLQQASASCITELEAALQYAASHQTLGSIVVAYEPQWAIGAPAPAPPEHIRHVCGALRQWVASRGSELPGSRVIYGGSAGHGLLSRLADSVNGLFLGRFVHDPNTFKAILD
ncbi:MAG TPA: triose-phosphate isomerase family protein, partial [Propionibacteriaceae bacterium]|nr:triose-phosphate isomerase family protein [Propionibacteriaceae bacterium]